MVRIMSQLAVLVWWSIKIIPNIVRFYLVFIWIQVFEWLLPSNSGSKMRFREKFLNQESIYFFALICSTNIATLTLTSTCLTVAFAIFLTFIPAAISSVAINQFHHFEFLFRGTFAKNLLELLLIMSQSSTVVLSVVISLYASKPINCFYSVQFEIKMTSEN